MDDKQVFQVEGMLWLRARIRAGSPEEAAELLLNQVLLDEDGLAELCDGEYEAQSVGGPIVEGRDLDEARGRRAEDGGCAR